MVHGTAETTTGPNQITTSYIFDGFGNTAAELRADGTSTRTYRYNCDAACQAAGPSTAVIYTVTQANGAPTAKTYIDKLAREVRKTATMIDGREAIVDTVYDNLGRVAQKSEPYFAGDRDSLDTGDL